MKAIIFFSMSKKQSSRNIAMQIEGDHFEIVNQDKAIKFAVFQMFYYGYKTVVKKEVKFQSPNIDFDKYNEIVLVSPVWAGKANIFMVQYLAKNRFMNKEVTIIGSSMGENKNYFKSFDNLIDESNRVVEHISYIKGSKAFDRKV